MSSIKITTISTITIKNTVLKKNESKKQESKKQKSKMKSSIDLKKKIPLIKGGGREDKRYNKPQVLKLNGTRDKRCKISK